MSRPICAGKVTLSSVALSASEPETATRLGKILVSEVSSDMSALRTRLAQLLLLVSLMLLWRQWWRVKLVRAVTLE